MADKKRQQKTEDIALEVGGNNIFADIGIANAEEELTKAGQAYADTAKLKIRRGLTKAELGPTAPGKPGQPAAMMQWKEKGGLP